MLFFVKPSFSVEYDPKVRFDHKCYQTMGKQYYSDGEIDNITLDSKPITLKTINDQQMIMEIGSEIYNYKSGIVYKGNDGVQRFNLLFLPSNPNLLRTKSASVLIFASRPLTIHLIFTEPLMGKKRSFVRTSFYNCKG